jgi:hypothetical protein
MCDVRNKKKLLYSRTDYFKENSYYRTAFIGCRYAAAG